MERSRFEFNVGPIEAYRWAGGAHIAPIANYTDTPTPGGFQRIEVFCALPGDAARGGRGTFTRRRRISNPLRLPRMVTSDDGRAPLLVRAAG